MTADEIIAALDLKPHPEGGWFAQTFRDQVGRDPSGGWRGASTLIYFLLKAGERSHWHRLHSAAEVWHYYAGAALRLMLSRDGETVETQMLGPDIASGERPQGIIPAGCWQAAETTGDFTLVGCTVAPGFTFEDFELAEPGWSPGG